MIKIPLKAGHHRAASWRPDEGLTLNSGQVALRFFSGSGPVLRRKPIFCDLSGLVRTPCPPPSPSGSAHASQEIFSQVRMFPWFNQY